MAVDIMPCPRCGGDGFLGWVRGEQRCCTLCHGTGDVEDNHEDDSVDYGECTVCGWIEPDHSPACKNNRSPTMPDAKTTEGERIAGGYSDETSVQFLRLSKQINAAIASSSAAKDAEIERLRTGIGEALIKATASLDRLRSHMGDDTITQDPWIIELAAMLKEPTNDHHT